MQDVERTRDGQQNSGSQEHGSAQLLPSDDGVPALRETKADVSQDEDLLFETVLVLSTAHVARADADILECEPTSSIVVLQYPERWMVKVGTMEEATYVDNFICDGFSGAFCDLVVLGRRAGCRWLRLDADGPIVPSLPTFDWEEASD